MPTPISSRLPKYRHYKPKDLAVVRIDGRDIYLGKYGSDESREKYRRVIAEWLAAGSPRSAEEPQAAQAPALTIGEVILAFWTRHAEHYYRRADGTPTGELDNFRLSLRPLNRLYGHTPARDFGPLALKAVRQSMIDSGLCRSLINQRIGRVIRVFKWATENELIPAGVHYALKAVAGLRKGRTQAPEREPVRPVPEAHIEVIRPHVSRQVWAMVQLQLLTGMRPGEVTLLRTGDVDRTSTVWVYAPQRHKTEHHDKDRRIFLGPRAQAVLLPWLRSDPTAYLFSPREAAEERWSERRRHRKSPMTPSQRARRPKVKPQRAPGPVYDTRAYAHAIHRACRKAGVPIWGPNRLRHNAATSVRKEFGLDTARAVLGHGDVETTTIYAERDQALAMAAMERIG